MSYIPRKAFQIQVRNTMYDVYRIEEKKTHNDDTLWIYFSKDPLPDGVIPPIDSPYWEPYDDHIPRRNFEIHFVQTTSTKEKWGATQFNSRTGCAIHCNGQLFYSFGTTGGSRGLSFAMAKAQYLITALSEHPFNFFDPQSEHGRKIYWKGLPATVKVWRHDTPWEIGIVPDYTTGFSKQQWWEELQQREKLLDGPQKPKVDSEWDEIEKEHFAEDMDSDFINWGDAFDDQHIDWFRKDANTAGE